MSFRSLKTQQRWGIKIKAYWRSSNPLEINKKHIKQPSRQKILTLE